jgi:hypothetical protein
MQQDLSFSLRSRLRVSCAGLLLGMILGLAVVFGGLLPFVDAALPRTRAPAWCPGLHCEETATPSVRRGDLRQDAIQALSETSWHHGVCISSDTFVQDVFLYGPKHRNRVYLLIVLSRMIDGQFRVEELGSFDANKYPMNERCIPPEIWDSPLGKPEVQMMIGGVILLVIGWSSGAWPRSAQGLLQTVAVDHLLMVGGSVLAGVGILIATGYAVF